MNSQHFTPEQKDELTQIVRAAIADVIREELRDAGLRVDGQTNQEAAIADFLFLRSLRIAYTGTTSKIGGAVVLTLVTGIMWLIWSGVQSIFPPK